MRFLSKPAKGITKGMTLMAHQEPPGRSGASHNSQAKPKTIKPSKLPTATRRVVSIWRWVWAEGLTRGEEEVFMGREDQSQIGLVA
jgi:hypothetical protein